MNAAFGKVASVHMARAMLHHQTQCFEGVLGGRFLAIMAQPTFSNEVDAGKKLNFENSGFVQGQTCIEYKCSKGFHVTIPLQLMSLQVFLMNVKITVFTVLEFVVI